MSVKLKIDNFSRKEIRKLLDQCTAGQQEKFHRIFGLVTTMDRRDFDHAITLLERTISNNRENYE